MPRLQGLWGWTGFNDSTTVLELTSTMVSKKFPELGNHWGLVQESGVGGGFGELLLNVLLASFETIQAAGLIELPCATPSKGVETGGEVVVLGVAVGVVELLSAIGGNGIRWTVAVDFSVRVKLKNDSRMAMALLVFDNGVGDNGSPRCPRLSRCSLSSDRYSGEEFNVSMVAD